MGTSDSLLLPGRLTRCDSLRWCPPLTAGNHSSPEFVGRAWGEIGEIGPADVFSLGVADLMRRDLKRCMASEISIRVVDAGDILATHRRTSSASTATSRPAATPSSTRSSASFPILGDIAPPDTVGAAIGHAWARLATAVAALAHSDQVGQVHLTSARRLLAVAGRSLTAACAAASLTRRRRTPPFARRPCVTSPQLNESDDRLAAGELPTLAVRAGGCIRSTVCAGDRRGAIVAFPECPRPSRSTRRRPPSDHLQRRSWTLAKARQYPKLLWMSSGDRVGLFDGGGVPMSVVMARWTARAMWRLRQRMMALSLRPSARRLAM